MSDFTRRACPSCHADQEVSLGVEVRCIYCLHPWKPRRSRGRKSKPDKKPRKPRKLYTRKLADRPNKTEVASPKDGRITISLIGLEDLYKQRDMLVDLLKDTEKMIAALQDHEAAKYSGMQMPPRPQPDMHPPIAPFVLWAHGYTPNAFRGFYQSLHAWWRDHARMSSLPEGHVTPYAG